MSKVKTRLINGVKYVVGESYRKPKKGECYLYKDGNYYPYLGKFSDDVEETGLYNKNGKIHLHIEQEEDNSEDLINSILKDTNTIKQNAKEVAAILNEEDKKKIFAPQIRDADNVLIRLIKEKLAELQIPEKTLASRFDSVSEWNNYKRALKIRHSITIECFARWMSILHIEWHIETTLK